MPNSIVSTDKKSDFICLDPHSDLPLTHRDVDVGLLEQAKRSNLLIEDDEPGASGLKRLASELASHLLQAWSLLEKLEDLIKDRSAGVADRSHCERLGRNLALFVEEVSSASRVLAGERGHWVVALYALRYGDVPALPNMLVYGLVMVCQALYVLERLLRAPAGVCEGGDLAVHIARAALVNAALVFRYQWAGLRGLHLV